MQTSMSITKPLIISMNNIRIGGNPTVAMHRQKDAAENDVLRLIRRPCVSTSAARTGRVARAQSARRQAPDLVSVVAARRLS